MTDKTFDEGFLDRLSPIIEEIVPEHTPPDDDFEDGDIDLEIDRLYEQSGGDLAQAHREIDALHRERRQAFARILQFLADQYGLGPIEELADEKLKNLAREGDDVTARWSEDAEMADARTAPKVATAVQRLLKEHYELGETILNIRDEIMAPYTRLYGGGDTEDED